MSLRKRPNDLMVRSLGTEDKGLNTDSLKQSVKHASDAGDLAKKKKNCGNLDLHFSS